jgi:hypothetical protein
MAGKAVKSGIENASILWLVWLIFVCVALTDFKSTHTSSIARAVFAELPQLPPLALTGLKIQSPCFACSEVQPAIKATAIKANAYYLVKNFMRDSIRDFEKRNSLPLASR